MSANHLSAASQALSHTMARVSTGDRIQRIGDDAAGAAVGIKLSTKVTSGSQAIRNANDGISLIQTSVAALNETGNLLSRLREITVQSASETLASTEREYIVAEYKQIATEIERIGDAADFNDLHVGDGSTYDVQVGVDGSTFSRIEIRSADIDSIHGHISALNLSDDEMSQLSLKRIDISIAADSSMPSTISRAAS